MNTYVNCLYICLQPDGSLDWGVHRFMYFKQAQYFLVYAAINLTLEQMTSSSAFQASPVWLSLSSWSENACSNRFMLREDLQYHRRGITTLVHCKRGGSSLTVSCTGQIEYFADLNIGLPSEFMLTIMSVWDICSWCRFSRYSSLSVMSLSVQCSSSRVAMACKIFWSAELTDTPESKDFNWSSNGSVTKKLPSRISS